MQVSACPGGAVAGYTYFIPSEEHLESRVTTRGFMEARMVVALAGRRAADTRCPCVTHAIIPKPFSMSAGDYPGRQKSLRNGGCPCRSV